MMRPFLFLLLLTFSISALAQDPAAVAAAQAGCGPSNVKFDVKDDNSQHAVGQPEAGKALVYVIQDYGISGCIGGCITAKIGLDGAWVGANHRSSYLFLSVDPGEHHLCANWQSHLDRFSRVVGLAHLNAEAGKVYFFRTRAIGVQSQGFFDFEPIDSDQGKLFVASFPLSVSHPKH